MSLYLRLVIGPVVICDIELFGTTPQGEEPPAQLAGGQGQVVYPEPLHEDDPEAFGFSRRPLRHGYRARPSDQPKPPPPDGPAAASLRCE